MDGILCVGGAGGAGGDHIIIILLGVCFLF